MLQLEIATTIAVLVVTAVVYIRLCMRIIQLDSIGQRIFWTFRAWLWGYPVPIDLSRWQLTNPDDVELYGKEVRTIQHAWKFLEPFFSSHGYTLYHTQPPAIFTLLPTPIPPSGKTVTESSYPFARCLFKDDREAEFGFMVNLVLH